MITLAVTEFRGDDVSAQNKGGRFLPANPEAPGVGGPGQSAERSLFIGALDHEAPGASRATPQIGWTPPFARPGVFPWGRVGRQETGREGG